MMDKIVIICIGMLLTSCASTPVEIPEVPTTDTPNRPIQSTQMPESFTLTPSATILTTPSSATSTPMITDIPKITPSNLPGSQGVLSQRAIDDLARRLQVNPTAIQLVKIFPDEFPASNLGCPSDSGKSLPIPAIVSGQTIILEYHNARYIYHARATEIVFCGEG